MDKKIIPVILVISLFVIFIASGFLAISKVAKVAGPKLFPTPTIPTPTPKPWIYSTPTEEGKKWLIAAGGIISSKNGENVTTLKSDMFRNVVEYVAKSSWDVTDRESAIKTLNWLRDEGHRSQYDAMVGYLDNANIPYDQDLRKKIVFFEEFIKKNRNEIGNRSLLAWDYDRLMNVARWSYTLGYITEEEAWKYMLPAGIELQNTYSSWDQLGSQHILGRIWWSQNYNQQEDVFYMNQMKKTWKTLDWNTKLQ